MLGDVCDGICSSYIQPSMDLISDIRGIDVEMGPNGSVYAVGETSVDIAGQIGLDDFVLIEIDSNGNTLWTKQFGTIERDWMGRSHQLRL